MTKTYHTAVFIGRFQPIHKAHEYIIREGLKIADEVIVVVGSSFAAPTLRNPFTFEQRREMIKAVFPFANVKVVPVMDYPYNDKKWINAVKTIVSSNRSYTPDPMKTVLIGHGKDESSYYLNLFPSWSSFDPGVSPDGMLNATDIREQLYTTREGTVLSKCSKEVEPVIRRILWKQDGGARHTDQYQTLLDEYDYAKKYKEDFGLSPYGKEPIHTTVDAIVTQADKVLLIRRKGIPGKGLWALPGGFLEPNERILDGTLRELKEETVLKLPEPVLIGSIKGSHVFDAPHRSIRGRVISYATYFELNREKPLPKVKGADDAWSAEWVDIECIDSQTMFEDHFGILDYFLNIA